MYHSYVFASFYTYWTYAHIDIYAIWNSCQLTLLHKSYSMIHAMLRTLQTPKSNCDIILWWNIYHKLSFGSLPESFFCVAVDVVVVVMPFIWMIPDDDVCTSIFVNGELCRCAICCIECQIFAKLLFRAVANHLIC